MKRYRIEGALVQLPAGSTVELTLAQAAARLYCLDGGALSKHHGKAGDRRAAYTLSQNAWFKAGEIVHWDGEVPKAMRAQLIDIDAEQAAADAAAVRALEAERERQENEAAAKLADQRHQALVAALGKVHGDENGNVNADAIIAAIAAAKLDYEPTEEQAQAAWDAVQAARSAQG